MKNKLPLITSIIVHYNSPSDCSNIVNDLLATTYENHTIIIIDNCSTPQNRKKVSRLTNENVLLFESDKNRGYGGGINFGVSQISHLAPSYIQVINADTTVVNKKYITDLIEVLEQDKSISLIGPKVLLEPGKSQNTILPFSTLKNIMSFKKKFSSKSEEYTESIPVCVDVINGVCFVVRYSAFKEVNGFDEDFFMYGEEQDLCYRLKQHGYKSYYLPILSISHTEGNVNDKLINWRTLLIYANQVMFLKKHTSKWYALILSIIFTISFIKKSICGYQLYGVNKKEILMALFNPKLFNSKFLL